MKLRHFFRCIDSCESIVLDFHDPMDEQIFFNRPPGDPLVCGSCGSEVEHMGLVVAENAAPSEKKPQRCDLRCSLSTGPVCVCVCQGQNHGAGKVARLELDPSGDEMVWKIVDPRGIDEHEQLALEFRAVRDECMGLLGAVEVSRLREIRELKDPDFRLAMRVRSAHKKFLLALCMRTWDIRQRRLARIKDEAWLLQT